MAARKTKKQTSDEVSTLAAQYMNRCKAYENDKLGDVTVGVPVSELKKMCASLLGQDETPRPKRARKLLGSSTYGRNAAKKTKRAKRARR